MELLLFEEVADALYGMVPAHLGALQQRPRRYGIKLWFGSAATAREHYEAQVISPDAVRDAKVLALEIGFHAEHPQAAENDAVLAHLAQREHTWRRIVGKEAVMGPFLGRADVWRRVSETWADPNLDDPELAMSLATRLTDYVTAIEPLRRER
jgi:hypothetical protein